MKKNTGGYPCPMVMIPGWMTFPELEWLYQTAKRFKTIVEIGSAYGRSSHALLTGNYEEFQSEGKVYCVDTWGEFARKTVFLNRVGHFPNLKIIELPSLKASCVLVADMIFIDGDTRNIKEDLSCWGRAAKFVCGHDYSEKYPDVVECVNAKFGETVKFVGETSIWYVEEVKC